MSDARGATDRSSIETLRQYLQQCSYCLQTLRNLASARSVIIDERDNWMTVGPTPINGQNSAVGEMIMNDFNGKIRSIDQSYNARFHEIVDSLNKITSTIWSDIQQTLNEAFSTWRYSQKQSQLGYPEDTNLRTTAETQLRDLMGLLYHVDDVITELQSSAIMLTPEMNRWLDMQRRTIRQCCRSLLQRSFVVLKQPSMLVKDWTMRMDLSVTIMADVATFGSQRVMRQGPVYCCMIAEKQAETLRSWQEVDFSKAPANSFSFGYLSHGGKRDGGRDKCVQSQWCDSTGMAEFNALRTKVENRKTNETKDKVTKADTNNKNGDKRQDKTTQKKIYFLFFCQVQIFGESHWLWTLSLPFVVAVQTMQEWHLLGVIFWDTAFSTLDALPCYGRNEVTWKELSTALKWLFSKEINADNADKVIREMSADELHHLGTRLFGWNRCFNDDSIVRRADVFERTLCDANGKINPLTGMIEEKSFTFWQWFYACMDLLQDKSGKILRYHNCKRNGKRPLEDKRTMVSFYNDGIIRGFIGKETAKRLLRDCRQTNIMLIRFSDNQCRHDDPNSVPGGYLSITRKTTTQDGYDNIIGIKPLNRELLSRLTLPFIIVHCDQLKDVKYIYIDSGCWVDKQVLTVNYLPILRRNTLYEGYVKLRLNFDNENKDEEKAPTPSSTIASVSPTFARDISSDVDSIPASSSFTESPLSTEWPLEDWSQMGENLNGIPQADVEGFQSVWMSKTRLVQMLNEPSSRQGITLQKYDDVLPMLFAEPWVSNGQQDNEETFQSPSLTIP